MMTMREAGYRERPDHAAELAAEMAHRGPFWLCDQLGLRHKRETNAARLCCRFHDERTASATLAIGPHGTLRFHCFGSCGRSWDALALIAQERRLSTTGPGFTQVLLEAAHLCGRQDIVDDIEGRSTTPYVAPAPRPAPEPPPPPVWPDAGEVAALWAACAPVTTDAEASAYLDGRAIDAGLVESLDLARVLPQVLPTGARMPRWAWCGGWWPARGYRLIVPVFDATGTMRSLRAWTFAADAHAKRVAPVGHTTAGLVMADTIAREVLTTGRKPAWLGDARLEVVISEGEPDWLTWATAGSDASESRPAVIGVVGSAWSADIAARIPDGARVAVRTHHDEPGQKYAADIIASLTNRCDVRRSRKTDT
jgi:hypothetical protein